MDQKFRNNSLLLIHDGNQRYFHACLKLNRIFNQVYVINSHLNKKEYDYYLDRVMRYYERFEEKYCHMSANPEWIEKLCFKRYFLAYSFLISNNLDSIWLIDSDLVTFTDFEKLYFKLKLERFDAALSIPSQEFKELHWSASPHCSWWNKDSLLDFISFINNTYSFNLDILSTKYDKHKNTNSGGGICDMTLLYLWSLNKKILNTADAAKTRGIFIDHNINLATNYGNEHYDYRYEMKHITKRKNNSFLIRNRALSSHYVAALHFQGKAKLCLILLCYLSYDTTLLLNYAYSKVYEILNFFRRF